MRERRYSYGGNGYSGAIDGEPPMTEASLFEYKHPARDLRGIGPLVPSVHPRSC